MQSTENDDKATPDDHASPSGLADLDIHLLRKDVAFWIEQSDTWKKLASDERDRANRAEALTDAKVERAARAMFEAGGVDERDWKWADVVREEPMRAELWRNDARQVVIAIIEPEATA